MIPPSHNKYNIIINYLWAVVPTSHNSVLRGNVVPNAQPSTNHERRGTVITIIFSYFTFYPTCSSCSYQDVSTAGQSARPGLLNTYSVPRGSGSRLYIAWCGTVSTLNSLNIRLVYGSTTTRSRKSSCIPLPFDCYYLFITRYCSRE